MAGRLSVRSAPYSEAAFWDEVRRACGCSQKVPPDQVRYLTTFLGHPEVGARAILVEEPYIDRHFIEEYTGYYATALRAPTPRATRLHLFNFNLEPDEFREMVERAASGEYDEVRSKLQGGYLGFVVVRPIPSCPIGRTILRPYPTDGGRRFYTQTEHTVHLCGIELTVPGVPFQQQDQAVGACATTAIWSALAKVVRANGGRAPTPLAVTTAATKSVLQTRAFPAVDGLTAEQMVAAVREFGYSPHLMKPHESPAAFKLALKCYLRSGIPVILLFDGKPYDHAVAAVGFREAEDAPRDSESLEPSLDITVGSVSGAHVKSRGFSRLYIHDDRLGPYARMTWEDATAEGDSPKLKFKAYGPAFGVLEEKQTVFRAIAPLYPKLRLSARDLISTATELSPLMRELAGEEDRDQLHIDTRFDLAGRYLRDLFDGSLSPSRTATLATSAFLSRYVGVIRFMVGDRRFADVVCDSTDILRPVPQYSPVIAFIPFAEQFIDTFKECAQRHFPRALVL